MHPSSKLYVLDGIGLSTPACTLMLRKALHVERATTYLTGPGLIRYMATYGTFCTARRMHHGVVGECTKQVGSDNGMATMSETCRGVGHAWQYDPFSSVVLVDYSGW